MTCCTLFWPPLGHIWRRQWHPTPVLLPGKSHWWRSLVGCSSWGRYELDTTEQLHFHFSLLCIGEGNGNPLQYSCLENPRDRGAWWAAIYGVAQSRTQLKQLSSSSSTSSRAHQSLASISILTFAPYAVCKFNFLIPYSFLSLCLKYLNWYDLFSNLQFCSAN